MTGFKKGKPIPPAPPPPAEDPTGVYFGRYAKDGFIGGNIPIYRDGLHILTIGPNGSGKGLTLAANLLRMDDGSKVIIDSKAELVSTTAFYRKTLGDVVIFNPFKVLGIEGVGFNPLASLDPSSDLFYDDCAGVAEALIRIEEHDPHWTESAESLSVGAIMWEVQTARRNGVEPSLMNLRRLLTEPDQYQTSEDGRRRLVKGVRINFGRMCQDGGPKVRSLIGKFLRDNDEISGISSTWDRQTRWLLSTPMERNLAGKGFSFETLKQRKVTVFIVLPPERLRTHSVWLRLLIVSALRALYRSGGEKTLLVIDEFAAVGYLPSIEDAFGISRGYGVQIWPILQDLNQLKALYKDRWETFMANAGMVQCFGPNDLTTAEWMSKRAGETTAVALSGSRSETTNPNGSSRSDSLSYQQIRRPLIMPHEMFDLPHGHGYLWKARSSMTIPFVMPPYWDDPVLGPRARQNPYYDPRAA